MRAVGRRQLTFMAVDPEKARVAATQTCRADGTALVSGEARRRAALWGGRLASQELQSSGRTAAGSRALHLASATQPQRRPPRREVPTGGVAGAACERDGAERAARQRAAREPGQRARGKLALWREAYLAAVDASFEEANSLMPISHTYQLYNSRYCSPQSVNNL